MQKIYIDSKDAFKAVVREDIKKDDIFYDQYFKASDILIDIMDASEKYDSEIDGRHKKIINNEYPNNIIAFCGNRGEGKTSAMLTFANAVYSQSSKGGDYIEIDKLKNKLTCSSFSEPIVIDPSMFDESHNIMDIVLAKLYEKFSDICNNGKLDYDRKDDMYTRQNLANDFEKVYRCVSLIANPDKIKEQEFDYDGNIGKLSKLGESTMLRKKFKILVDDLLKFVAEVEPDRNKSTNRKLIIAIDDLDLSNDNAYSMAEQIRKYLIIPNVVIIMALKIDQLELCVMEKNIADFERLSKLSKDNLDIAGRVQEMAEKYITKLIPQNHRVNMPKLRRNTDVTVVYNNKENDKLLINQTLDEIYEKTGMIFIKDEYGDSYLVPDSMRELVNFLVMLNDELKTDEDSKVDNIKKFYNYCSAVFRDISKPSVIRGLDFVTENENKLHFKTIYFLLNQVYDEIDSETKSEIEEIYNEGKKKSKNSTFSDVINVLTIIEDRVNTESVKRSANIIKIIYTAYLTCCQKDGFKYRNFIGDYIWGDLFTDVMPIQLSNKKPLSRFEIQTIDLINILLQKDIFNKSDDGWYLHEDEIIDDVLDGLMPADDKEKEEYILTWLLIGLFVDTGNTKAIIYDDAECESVLSVSIENYIYRLSNLGMIYDMLNLSAKNVEKKDFQDIVSKIEGSNIEIIKCARYICSSIDIILDFLNHCKGRKQYFEKVYSFNAEVNTIDLYFEVTEWFFDCIVSYMQMKLDIDVENIEKLVIGDNKILIPKLYGYMYEDEIDTNKKVKDK